MSADAAEWSERDLDRRFGLGPPRDEFTRLAATLDGLLDRLSAGIRREQRFSAELSHELRTPLAKIRARSQLALTDGADQEEARAALAGAVAETDNLTRALEALMAAARAEARAPNGSSADALEVAASVAAQRASEEGAEGTVAIDVNGADGLRVAVDPDLIERILHPIVENACRHARGRVAIAVAGDASEVSYLVTDDGEGVGSKERLRIFEPGVSGGGEGRNGESGGAGLGLALARRLARAGGGEVEALSSEGGGRFSIRLPRA
jgi:two-component system OmpR family sensor kinase